MKLLLTSAGLTNEKLEKAFLSLLTKPPRENKALIMGVAPGIQDFDLDAYFNDNKQMLIKQGLLEKNIDSYKLDDDNPPSLENIDILWMLGGNNYRHMKWIRKQGLIPEIRKFIENNGVYSGRSTGAMIMSPDIDENLTIDVNDIGLKDVTGFGYIDYYLLVHWDTLFDELHTDAIKYSWNIGKRVIPLTDQQAVLVLNNEFKIISP